MTGMEIALVLAAGTACGVIGWASGTSSKRIVEQTVDDDRAESCAAEDGVTEEELTPACGETLEDFSVNGPPRRVPWRVKRRALEAQHRETRRRLEEWE